MILPQCCISFILGFLISYGCAGPTTLPSLIDAPSSTLLQTRTHRNNNILSYPAALSGASGVSIPSPFKLSGNQYKNIFVSPNINNNNNNKKQLEDEVELLKEIKPEALQEQHQAPSQYHPKYVTPHTQEIRPYRQVEHYIIRPTIIPEGIEVPTASQNIQESQEIQQDYTTVPSVALPQAFQLPVHHIPYSNTPVQQYLHKETQHSSHEVKEENKAKYEFMYRVQDNDFHPTGVGRSEPENIPSDFGHSEARDGEKTWGRYFVKLPDGRVQTVRYWADHSGYHAEVQFEGKAHHPEPKDHNKYYSATKHQQVKLFSNYNNQPQYNIGEYKQLQPNYEAYTSRESDEEKTDHSSEES